MTRPPGHVMSAWLLCVCGLVSAGCGPAASPVLRVCADPNNLPFSNRAEEGFENRIATLLATDQHATLQYTWRPQRRGFVRSTLNAGTCDVVVGVPAGFELVDTTQPYYRSTYVFLSRRDRDLDVSSFDDARLRRLRVGVQMIGDDMSNSPPAHALSRRGIFGNVIGYSVFGNYADPAPLSAIVEAVQRGDVDLAVVWGPTAGYFARQRPALALRPVVAAAEPALPFAFDIALGVKRGNHTLRDELDGFLVRRRKEIDGILTAYGVPLQERTRHAPAD